MAKIDTFVQTARKKGLSETDIRAALETQGWDKALITPAIAGVEVPTPPSAKSSPTNQSSLSPLMAALHHILLWFFTGSAAVTISGVVASLSGYEVSPEALASMIAVTVVTFLPYALLFILYLRKAKRSPEFVPGRVWSIITICLHSVGAMAAAITLVVNAIVEGEQSVLISAALILFLMLIVVTVYSFAAFVHSWPRLRSTILISYLPLVAILLGILVTLSILQLGPARHDQQLRKGLVQAVETTRSFANDHDALPTETSQVTTQPDISYNQISDTTYQLCGTFKANYRRSESTLRQPLTQPQSDAGVSEYDFRAVDSGEQCFEFKSAYLTNPSS